MIGVINKLYGKTWNLDGVTYENGIFTFTPNVLAMSTCAMPNPVAGHLYYGSVEQKAPAGSSFPDRRFEWWVGDEVGNVMTFAYMEGTNDQWVRQSSVLKVDAVVKDGWIMRNFTANGTAEAYRRNPIIIDLTEAFGAGNEPTAAWVDANMIPSEKGDVVFFNIPSAFRGMSDKRRMMMGGKGKPDPLYLFNPSGGALQNVYSITDPYKVGTNSYLGTALQIGRMNIDSGTVIFYVDVTDYTQLTLTIYNGWLYEDLISGEVYSLNAKDDVAGNLDVRNTSISNTGTTHYIIGSKISGTKVYDISDIKGYVYIAITSYYYETPTCIKNLLLE